MPPSATNIDRAVAKNAAWHNVDPYGLQAFCQKWLRIDHTCVAGAVPSSESSLPSPWAILHPPRPGNSGRLPTLRGNTSPTPRITERNVAGRPPPPTAFRGPGCLASSRPWATGCSWGCCPSYCRWPRAGAWSAPGRPRATGRSSSAGSPPAPPRGCCAGARRPASRPRARAHGGRHKSRRIAPPPGRPSA